jgi:hypothetical protein
MNLRCDKTHTYIYIYIYIYISRHGITNAFQLGGRNRDYQQTLALSTRDSFAVVTTTR